MSTDHTPGPWIALPPDSDCKSWSIIWGPGHELFQEGDSYVLAFMAIRVSDPNIPTENDARLIAAAPELLEALEIAKHYLDEFWGEPWYDIDDPTRGGVATKIKMEKIESVIAKAKGTA